MNPVCLQTTKPIKLKFGIWFVCYQESDDNLCVWLWSNHTFSHGDSREEGDSTLKVGGGGGGGGGGAKIYVIFEDQIFIKA